MKNLINEWQIVLKSEFNSEYMQDLKTFLKEERAKFKVFPEPQNVFYALNLVKPSDVKVIIVGQDPYHQAGQAHGLSFSVLNGTKLPPSLINIFKEIEADIGIQNSNGDLTPIAKQGVLFLNTSLTVREGVPASHKGKGWEVFTKAIIKHLNDNFEKIIFVLWGNFAKQFKNEISNAHYVLEAAHPSPFSAYSGFFGCKHFSKINEILKKDKKTTIDFKT